MSDSIRERCMQALVTRFQDQVAGAPSGTRASGETLAYDFAWDCVVRWPLTDQERQQEYSLAILEQEESKNDQMRTRNAFLQMELEFHVIADSGNEPATVLNCVLLNIQRQLNEDITLGGLAIDLRETGNSVVVQSFEDRLVEGSVFVTLQYKHTIEDPREVVPGTVP